MPSPTDIEQRLCEGLAVLGVQAPSGSIGRLATYLGLLGQWNKAYNLTRVTDPDDMVVRHILDSAAIMPWLHGASILDAGSGAGLPGIPLALLDPARRFTLADSGGKKVRFLRQVVLELRLGNVTPVHSRLESWQPVEPFDTVVCRAFATLAGFIGACAHLVAPGGRLLAMKGRRPDAELTDIPAPWRATALERITVPGLDAERHLVVMER